ncbi:hypothetical protein BC833DRAFT_575812 [Globomyces pollinis-pini]|nr:hypothetical protein BC833DRAFT_575812 [Globomyces pollinis-pini]
MSCVSIIFLSQLIQTVTCQPIVTNDDDIHPPMLIIILPVLLMVMFMFLFCRMIVSLCCVRTKRVDDDLVGDDATLKSCDSSGGVHPMGLAESLRSIGVDMSTTS